MNIRRVAAYTLAAIAIIGVLGCAVLSPLALVAVSDSFHLDWEQLSKIGEAYGAAAAVFSALAFAGVSASIAFQARAIHQQRTQAVREQHRELLRMLIDQPEIYATAFEPARQMMDPTELRRDVFTQLWMINFMVGYTSGYYSEKLLRGSDGIPSVLSAPHARQYWKRVQQRWTNSPDATFRRFGRIVNDVYMQTGGDTSVPKPSLPTTPAPPARENSHGRDWLAVSVFVAAGLLADRRRRRR